MSKKASMCVTLTFADIKASLLKQDTRMKTVDALDILEKQFGSAPIVICGETKQRVASEYQRFTGECMKSGGSLKECAQRWREKKNGGPAAGSA